MIDHLVHTDYKAVDKRDHVGSLYGWLRGEHADVPIVCDREKPYGVVNERAFMRSRVTRDAKIENYVVGTATVTPESPIDRVFEVIANSRIALVPVTGEGGKDIKGYVTAADALGARDVPDGVTVSEVLTEVPILTTKSNVGEAIHYLRDVSTHVLPVTDENQRTVGVVLRRELMKLVMDARPSGRKPANGELEDRLDGLVEGYVRHDYDSVRPEARLADARDALTKLGFLVVENAQGKPVGVVTPENAVAELARRR